MRHRALAVFTAAVIAAASLAGCGGEDLPEHEQQYIDSIYNAQGALRAVGVSRLLEAGYAVCDELVAGVTPADVAAEMSRVDGPISRAATEVVAAADAYLCD